MSKRRNLATPNMADLSAHAARRPSGIMAMGHRPPEDINNVLAALNPALATLSERLEAQGVERAEISARLAAVEQMIADPSARFGGAGYSGEGFNGPSAGSSVLNALADDAMFQVAQTAAQRSQRLPSIDVRSNLELSIRAALTNTPSEGTSSDGTYMPSDPGRRVVGEVLRPLRLLDVLPSRPTDRDAIEYIRVEASGSASEQVLEGDTKAELDFVGEAAVANIVTVAGWTGASRQVLADHAALQGIIDRTLQHKVLSRFENQLINGPGGQGKVEGFLEIAPTLIPTIASEPADVVGEALVRLADAGYMPGLILLNALDWFRITIMRTQTEQEYLFGSPTMPVPPALWNTPIVVTPSMPEGTGLVVDTAYSTVIDRQQVSVTISTSHEDFFVRNLVAILAEMRGGLEVVDAFSLRQFDMAFPS